MIPLAELSWRLDGWIIVAAVLCAINASLLGSYLVLRRMSLLVDAISHAVLPGLAAAFLITGSRQSWPMFFGAVFVGILTAWLAQWTQSRGRVDEGAAIGVVFTGLFAVGLVMIVQAADRVDLDPGCVLYGAIEITPLDLVKILGVRVPRVVLVLSGVLLLNVVCIVLFYKELKLCSFDPGFADASGFSSKFIHYLLASLVALTSVASFESVGNILVVAMFIVPPCTALLLTERLGRVLILGAALATFSAVVGHLAAVELPGYLGLHSVSTSGTIAVVSGSLLALAAFFAPKHGLIPIAVGRWMLSRRILAEDILAALYRSEEKGRTTLPQQDLETAVLTRGWLLRNVLKQLQRKNSIQASANGWILTPSGKATAQNLVRSHRLWEQYLASEAGLAGEQLHAPAERLEHFTGRELRQQLAKQSESSQLDPHGRPIPPELHAENAMGSPKTGSK